MPSNCEIIIRPQRSGRGSPSEKITYGSCRLIDACCWKVVDVNKSAADVGPVSRTAFDDFQFGHFGTGMRRSRKYFRRILAGPGDLDRENPDD